MATITTFAVGILQLAGIWQHFVQPTARDHDFYSITIGSFSEPLNYKFCESLPSGNELGGDAWSRSLHAL